MGINPKASVPIARVTIDKDVIMEIFERFCTYDFHQKILINNLRWVKEEGCFVAEIYGKGERSGGEKTLVPTFHYGGRDNLPTIELQNRDLLPPSDAFKRSRKLIKEVEKIHKRVKRTAKEFWSPKKREI